MNDSRGTPGWARRVIGPIAEASGFRLGRKNARWASFVRTCADGRKLSLDFNPTMPEDPVCGGSFWIALRFPLNDWGDNYSENLVDLLPPDRLREFIAIHLDVMMKTPFPLGAFRGFYCSASFDWMAGADLEVWTEFLERVLPVVVVRTESGQRQNTGLIPGPGPGCPPGKIAPGMRPLLGESVWDEWTQRALGPVLETSGFRSENASNRRNHWVRTCPDGRELALNFSYAMSEPPGSGGSFHVDLRLPIDETTDVVSDGSNLVDLLPPDLRSEFITTEHDVLAGIPHISPTVLAAVPHSLSFDWRNGRDFHRWIEFLARALPPVVAGAESGTRQTAPRSG